MRSTLATAFLLAATSLSPLAARQQPASPPADLVALAETLNRFAEERGAEGAAAKQGESARLHRLFDLYWSIRMRQNPAFATYIGYPGLHDRWPDDSPGSQALAEAVSTSWRPG